MTEHMKVKQRVEQCSHSHKGHKATWDWQGRESLLERLRGSLAVLTPWVWIPGFQNCVWFPLFGNTKLGIHPSSLSYTTSATHLQTHSIPFCGTCVAPLFPLGSFPKAGFQPCHTHISSGPGEADQDYPLNTSIPRKELQLCRRWPSGINPHGWRPVSTSHEPLASLHCHGE